MEIDITQYLTEEQIQSAVQNAVIDAASKQVEQILINRYAGKIADTVFDMLVSKYVTMLDDKYSKSIMDLIQKQINCGFDKCQEANLEHHIRYCLQNQIDKAVAANEVELQIIFKEKVTNSANALLLNAFLAAIVKQLNIDEAIKQIFKQQAENIG